MFSLVELNIFLSKRDDFRKDYFLKKDPGIFVDV